MSVSVSTIVLTLKVLKEQLLDKEISKDKIKDICNKLIELNPNEGNVTVYQVIKEISLYMLTNNDFTEKSTKWLVSQIERYLSSVSNTSNTDLSNAFQ